MTSDRSEADRIRATYAGYGGPDGRSRLWSTENPGNQAIIAERERLVTDLLERELPVDRTRARVLDLGCGDGAVLEQLTGAGLSPHRLAGVDLLGDRLADGRRRSSTLPLLQADGSSLPFVSGSFDVALTFTVFSSIADDQVARAIAAELHRVIRPGGFVVWYDLRRNNPRNPNVRGMDRGAIDALFPGWSKELHTCTLLPPLARRLGSRTTSLYPRLAAVGALRTHHIGVLRHP